LYIAIEKGNTAIIKLLLGANPDLEISTKVNSTHILCEFIQYIVFNLILLLRMVIRL